MNTARAGLPERRTRDGQRLLAIALGMVCWSAWLFGVTLLVWGRAHDAHAFASWFEASVNGLAFSAVGTILTLRRPDQVTSWLFAALAAMAAVQLTLGQWAALAVAGLVPGAQGAGLATEALSAVLFPMLGVVLLCFPDGHPIGPLWRVLARVVAPVAMMLGVAHALIAPGALEEMAAIHNPLGGSAGVAHLLQTLTNVAELLLLPPAVVSIGVRWARSTRSQRQQLKPFVFAAGLWLAVFAITLALPAVLPPWWGHVSFGLGVLGIAAAATVSVLRYRLYDIDRVVSRTLSYAVLTGLLVLTYVALVAGIQAVLPAQSSLAVAASTLTVAALFQPLRRRVQRAVDHRFNRARYDSERVVDRFAFDLRQQVAIDSVTGDLVAVVHRTVQPAFASVWVRP